MVRAFIYFDTTDGPGFASAMAQAGPMLAGANGYHGSELLRGVENPDRWVLLVEWDSVDDHMAWMHVNEQAFLGAVGPYTTGGPDIKHFAPPA
jgi:heme-degrading monooxygenase HmoA